MNHVPNFFLTKFAPENDNSLLFETAQPFTPELIHKLCAFTPNEPTHLVVGADVASDIRLIASEAQFPLYADHPINSFFDPVFDALSRERGYLGMILGMKVFTVATLPENVIVAFMDETRFSYVQVSPIASAPVCLTPQQKLDALAFRFYSHQKWENPKTGDYYTTARADLELYVIVGEDDEHVYTSYLPLGGPTSTWRKDEFLDKGFGPCRVWVPPHVLARK